MKRVQALLVVPLVVLLTTSALLVTGCVTAGSSGSSGSSGSNGSNGSSGSNESNETNGSNETDDPMIFIEFASLELLNNTGSYDSFFENGSTVNVALTSNFNARDFRFIAILYTEVGGEFKFVDDGVLFSYGTLTPEKPLVIGTNFDGAIPNRGIAFLDTNGVEQYYALSLSGNDGLALLIPFGGTK